MEEPGGGAGGGGGGASQEMEQGDEASLSFRTGSSASSSPHSDRFMSFDWGNYPPMSEYEEIPSRRWLVPTEEPPDTGDGHLPALAATKPPQDGDENKPSRRWLVPPFLRPRKKHGKKKKLGPQWRIFSLRELHTATNGFNYDNKLSEGESESVYWGMLWDGKQVAVKRLKFSGNKVEMEFAVEVEILARTRHKNLITLLGYCAEAQERLIVCDYMPNMDLFSHLHGQFSADRVLDWEKRMNIALGSAEGIVYLHHYATPHIIHRDIKASSILLDSNFQAQVASFRFAKLIPDGATHVTACVKGTLGYLAPEYALFGVLSVSCDIYSFGILLLELVSGKKPIMEIDATMKRTIIDWALPLAQQRKFDEIADPKLDGRFVEVELKRAVLVGLVCAQSRPEKRPTMVDVVDLLKGISEEKLMTLEHDELFRPKSPVSGIDDSYDFISEEDIEKASNETVGSRSDP